MIQYHNANCKLYHLLSKNFNSTIDPIFQMRGRPAQIAHRYSGSKRNGPISDLQHSSEGNCTPALYIG